MLNEKINIDQLDIYSYGVLGTVSIILTTLIISSFVVVKESRRSPGDIILAIAISDFVLSIYWLGNGIYYFFHKQIPQDESLFCQLSGFLAMLGATGQFLYNCAYCIVLRIQITNILIISKRFQLILHLGNMCLILAVPSFLLSENQLQANGFGVCSVKMNTLFIQFGIFIILLYVGLSIYSIYYFKIYVPNSKKILLIKEKIMYRYIIYIACTIITWLLILAANVIITLIPDYQQNTWIKLVVYLGNISQIMGPIMLSLIRYSDSKVKHFLRGIFKTQKKVSTGSNLVEGDFEFSDISTQQPANSKNSEESLSNPLLKNMDQLLMKWKKQQTKLIVINIGNYFLHYNGNQNQNEIVSYPLVDKNGKVRNDAKMYVNSPELFKKSLISDNLRIDKESFTLEQNKQFINNLTFQAEGKSGMFFFFSHDQKWVLKSITDEEYATLKHILPKQIEYFHSNQESLLSRFYGLFNFDFDGYQQNEQISFKVVLQRNIAGIERQFIQRTYDLKGSEIKRKVLQKQHTYSEEFLKKKTLKDLDFKDQEKRVSIDYEVAAKLKKIIELDLQFLKELNLIDYSLLLQKLDLKKYAQEKNLSINEVFNIYPDFCQPIQATDGSDYYYSFAIIDYLQQFTLIKKTEKVTKQIINLDINAKVSIQSPEIYADRMMTNVITPYFLSPVI